jgi:hypothetical protein
MISLLLTIASICHAESLTLQRLCQKEYVQCMRDKIQQSPMKGRNDDFLWECSVEILKVK